MIILKKLGNIASNFLLVELFVILFLYTFIFFIFCDESDFSGFDEDKKLTPFERLFNMFYFTCVTCSTIGYGDIYPKTIKSRMICSTLILLVLYLTLI